MSCLIATAACLVLGEGNMVAHMLPDGTIIRNQTTVEIRETDEPGAVAELYYRNRAVNDSASDDRTHLGHFEGLDYEVRFDHDVGGASRDGIYVTPPEGYTCKPSCELLLHEGLDGVLYIIDDRNLF